MSNNIDNNNWIEAIKQKADQTTREVPEGTWEAIAKSLPKQPKLVKHYSSQPKRNYFSSRMWKAIAAAAAVAIVATTGFFIIQDDNNIPESGPIAQTPRPTQVIKSVPVDSASTDSTHVSPQIPVPQATLAQNKTTTSSLPKPAVSHSTPSVSKNHSIANQEQNIKPEEEYLNNDFEDEMAEFDPEEYFYDIETMQALEELYAEYEDAMNQEAMDPWKSYSDSSYHQHLTYDANARRVTREKLSRYSNKKKKPTLLMAAYGNGLISSDHDATVNSSSNPMLAPAAGGNNSAMMMAPAAPGMSNTVAPPINYKYHHHMPLTAGLTFNKRIVGNLYGNLGVNFTSMTSDVTPDNGAPEFKQKIMLVGLPFGVKWNFWRYRGLSTFIGAEGLMERVVSAKFNDESVTIKRLQWSIHATAGLQYNFSKHVGIYLAPKLSHYITTMPLNTIRNEHPLNFNLQLGISIDY